MSKNIKDIHQQLVLWAKDKFGGNVSIRYPIYEDGVEIIRENKVIKKFERLELICEDFFKTNL
jgi:hypothetical protein